MRAGVEALENEFLGTGKVQQSKILRRRTNEDQVVVSSIV